MRLATIAPACFFPGMTREKQKPAEGPHAEAARLARLEREAAALRENLRRRKAQARAQVPEATPAPPENGAQNEGSQT